jgi:hypothetical protein
MTRLALAAVLLAASTSAASAGTYLGIGIGTAANGSAESSNGADMGTTDGFERSGRLMVGSRFGKLSIEGQGSRYDTTFDHLGYQATQLGVGLKLNLPLGNNFEVFGKGGVERTWLSTDAATMHDAAGNGWFFAAGFEYRLNLGVTAASLFVDYQRSSTDFINDYLLEYNGASGMWTLGATVSL